MEIWFMLALLMHDMQGGGSFLDTSEWVVFYVPTNTV